MNLNVVMATLPDIQKVVSILSGGLDSTTLTHLLVKRYGTENVAALTFNYGQKQVLETSKAQFTCAELGIRHKVLDISFIGDIVRPVSANVQGSTIAMPTIKDVLGVPQSPTYVPARNAILLTISYAFAEANSCDGIFAAFQTQDEYGYYDTTEEFVLRFNSMFQLNRLHNIVAYAPFGRLDKASEIAIGIELGVNYASTLTCYNPDFGISCGVCPSCAERIRGFIKNGIRDPAPYAIDIKWS
ncbi:MAG: 7-cyano-7-deazaguanine synthase QueC [Nitrosopumilaceae archaeon]